MTLRNLRDLPMIAIAILFIAACIELDLVPLQLADLGCPQTMPIGEQDHGRVPLTVST